MKAIIFIAVFAILIGCASPKAVDPFIAMESNTVAVILVGDVVCDSGPFEGYDPKRSHFEPYFRIDDETTVRKLTDLMRQRKASDSFPLIGILAYQQFQDKRGRPLANTHIVNYDNAVVIADPFCRSGYNDVTRSEEFCRTIYNLMLKHCPERIEQQKKFYKTVNEDLDALLFEGKSNNGNAQPSPPK